MTAGTGAAVGAGLPVASVLPFAALLLSIALVPLAAPRFWGRHYGKVALALGAPVAAWFLFASPETLFRTLHEYASFLCLVGSLFVVSGGILVRGAPRATVRSNAAVLLLGALLSNVLGTTGASILLVRPLLRSNAGRPRSGHVMVFFIFLVSNVGGLLTPIGDPPLFLGYLQGVPFGWPLARLFPLWLFAVSAILAAFVAVDRRAFRKAGEGRRRKKSGTGGSPSAFRWKGRATWRSSPWSSSRRSSRRRGGSFP